MVSPETLFRDTVCRSLRQTAGVTGEPVSLFGVFDSLTWGYPAKAQFHQIVFDVEADGEISESGDRRLFSASEIDGLASDFDPITRKVLALHDWIPSDTPFFDLGDHRGAQTGQDAAAAPQAPAGNEMLGIAQRLEDVAREGLAHLEHPYAEERYRHIVSASDRLARIANQ